MAAVGADEPAGEPSREPEDFDDLFRRAGRDWLVDVDDGVVVVDGPSGEAERQLAEAITRSVPGVVALRVRSGPS